MVLNGTIFSNGDYGIPGLISRNATTEPEMFVRVWTHLERELAPSGVKNYVPSITLHGSSTKSLS